MNNQKLDKLADEIDNLKQKKIQQQKEIKRLENENNTKAELVARNQEKIKALEIELKERKKEFKYLTDGDSKDMTKIVKRDKNNTFTQDTINMLDNDLMFLEKFQNLLEDKISHMDMQFRDDMRKALDEYMDDPDLDFYAKSSIRTISIRYIGGKKFQEEENARLKNKKTEEQTFYSDYISMRLSPSTRFSDLIDLACKFWKLEPRTHELTDESFSQLPLEEFVETFLRTRHQESSLVLVILREKDTNCQILNPAMQDAIRLSDAAQKKKIDEVNLQRDIKEEIDKYKEFFNKFPGMKFYIDSDKVKEREKDPLGKLKNSKASPNYENHCCMFLIMVLLMSFTLKTLFGEFDVYQTYYEVASIQNIFGVQNDLLQLTATDKNLYNDIQDVDSMWSYIKGRIGKAFFKDVTSGSNNDFLQKNSLIGPLRLRSLRVKQKSCQKMKNVYLNVACYYDYYDSSTRDTETIGNGLQPWMYFKDISQTGEYSTIDGYYSSYDGSGYIADSDPNYVTYTDFEGIVGILNQGNFVDLNTRALIVGLNMYNIPGDYLILIQILIEFDVVGGIQLNQLTVMKFNFDLYDAGKVDHLTFDILKGILSSLVFVFIVYNMFFGERKKIKITYLFSSYGFLNFTGAVLTFVAIAKTTQYENLNLNPNIINSQNYVDLRNAADLYYEIFFYQAIAGGLFIIRVIYFLKMNAEFEIIFETLEKTGKLIITYCMLVIPLLLAFAISGMALWASISRSYVTLPQAFLSSILLALGRFDRDILIQADYLPTIIYLTIYYLFVIFFLITVLVGLYVDNYRITMMDYGYNFARFSEKKTVKDLFKWLFSWVPERVIQYAQELQLRTKKIKENKDNTDSKIKNLNNDNKDNINLSKTNEDISMTQGKNEKDTDDKLQGSTSNLEKILQDDTNKPSTSVAGISNMDDEKRDQNLGSNDNDDIQSKSSFENFRMDELGYQRQNQDAKPIQIPELL